MHEARAEVGARWKRGLQVIENFSEKKGTNGAKACVSQMAVPCVENYGVCEQSKATHGNEEASGRAVCFNREVRNDLILKMLEHFEK